MKRVIRLIVVTAALSALLVGGWLYYRIIVQSAVPEDLAIEYLYIPTGATFEEVVTLLKEQGVVRDEAVFRNLADRMHYERNPMRAGRFRVEPGMTMINLIRHLRSGPQAPVNVVLTNERLLEDVAAKVARFIEPDSAEFMALFTDPGYLNEIGYTRENLMTIFVPNTYEFFWNTDPVAFLERMLREHDKFWDTDGRRAKAEALSLSPQEVYTLASIVEKETLQNSEKPRMAGVYLNRLERDMLLQADPTSVFATRDFDTSRVTDYHTKYDSPYNTYLYKGLPPGPITMTSISSIDAVLNPEAHDYIFFCARGDGSGLHAFAETLQGHNQNAARYRRNLRARGLR